MNSLDSKAILVALDFASTADAIELAHQLSPAMCRLKVGKELFTRGGPELVRRLHALQFEVFLDLKFHDIPNTTAKALAAAADLGVWMVNVHASGGRRMLEAARKAIPPGKDSPLLIAVTLLTSMDEDDLASIGCQRPLQEQAALLAELAHSCDLDGVVCSAQEAAMMRQKLAQPFALVTPGIRPLASSSDDQRRIMTPRDAVAAGSDYLVIGRPITRADDPEAALQEIYEDLYE